MSRIDFAGELYSDLSSEEDELTELPDLEGLHFPLWDILKEIDRREKRRKRDVENTRRRAATRRYMREHPEIVERLSRSEGKV